MAFQSVWKRYFPSGTGWTVEAEPLVTTEPLETRLKVWRGALQVVVVDAVVVGAGVAERATAAGVVAACRAAIRFRFLAVGVAVEFVPACIYR